MAKTQVSNATEESIRFLDDGSAIVVKRSPFSREYHTMTMTLNDEQYSDWKCGVLIQNAMPHLTANEREFLITGITPEEWDDTFGEEPDDPGH
jgi:hypothetical protein